MEELEATRRNIVLLSDGTGNEPKLFDQSNILRLYKMLIQDNRQLVWYDPGVGTQEDPRALTRYGRAAIRVAGQAFGYGLKDNVVDAYGYLMQHYRPGDRVYLFGFSRGAFTSRAIAGLLFQVGLLRTGQENLIPYALKLFWWDKGHEQTEEKWKETDKFSGKFARSGFVRRSTGKIAYMGIWDTVNATGLLRGNLVLPWTASLDNVEALRHAVSIDERRRPYRPSLLKYTLEAKDEGRFKEVWFAGVHADVGGVFKDDHALSDIAMEWVVQGGIDRGLLIDQKRFKELRNQSRGKAYGTIHHDMGKFWALTEVGYRRKILPRGATVHESVMHRMNRSDDSPYRPQLPPDVKWEPWQHADSDLGVPS